MERLELPPDSLLPPPPHPAAENGDMDVPSPGLDSAPSTSAVVPPSAAKDEEEEEEPEEEKKKKLPSPRIKAAAPKRPKLSK